MVRIIKAYLDKTMNMKLIPVGTELDVPAEREKVLIDAGVAEKIETEETKVEVKKESTKKTSKKK